MTISTRIFRLYEQIKKPFENRILNLKSQFTQFLFFLLIGFLVGNIFGTFLTFLRKICIWDGFIIFLILLFVEITNFLTYSQSQNRFFSFHLNKKNIYYFLNNFKIGLMLGFFVDAFKVGS